MASDTPVTTGTMFNKLLLYIELMRMEFVNNLAYRATYFTGIFNYTIQIGAYYFLWGAIYSGRSSLSGFSKEEMVTYVIVAWVVRSFYFSNLDRRVAVEIRDGKIALELIRPYSYQLVKYARAFGEAMFRMIFFAIPSGIFIYLLRPFSLPPNTHALNLFLLSLLGSFLINAQISMLIGFVVFFTKSTTGIYKVKRMLLDLFSGLLIPINFYPGWAREIIKLMPFQSISYVPNLLYLGKLTGERAIHALMVQFLWIVVLGIFCKIVWKVAVKHVVIQGG